MGLAADGTLFTPEALMPLAITLAWIVAGSTAFAALYRRLARDN